MTQTLGSNAKVKWDRPKDRLNPKRTSVHLAKITVLTDEVHDLWFDAADAGVYSPRKESGGRGTGFEETDPTSRAALSPIQRQLRQKARRSAVLIEEALQRLEDAKAMLTDGFLLTDRETLARFLEKRQAAEQG